MFKKESDMIENQRKIEYFIQNPNNLLQRVRNKEILPIVAKPLAELLTEKLYALNALTRMRYENQEYMARITLCIDFLLVVELIHSENWLSESLLHYQSRESDLKILQKKYNQFCIIQENFKLIKSSN